MGIAIGNAIGVPFGIKKNTDMTYPVQTIDLAAGVEYDLTTTITDLHEIYNVLPDYGGKDANVDITWTAVGGVWHVYFYSVDAITGVKVKIIYK